MSAVSNAVHCLSLALFSRSHWNRYLPSPLRPVGAQVNILCSIGNQQSHRRWCLLKSICVCVFFFCVTKIVTKVQYYPYLTTFSCCLVQGETTNRFSSSACKRVLRQEPSETKVNVGVRNSPMAKKVEREMNSSGKCETRFERK